MRKPLSSTPNFIVWYFSCARACVYYAKSHSQAGAAHEFRYALNSLLGKERSRSMTEMTSAAVKVHYYYITLKQWPAK